MQEEIIFEDKGYKDLNPIRTGHEACTSNHSFGPAVRQNYLIHYVKSGTGRLYSPEGEYEVFPGQLFLIRPGEINTYTADREHPWDYIWVEFSGDATKLLEKTQKRVVDCGSEPFLRLLSLLKREDFREEFAISALFTILTSFFETGHQNLVSKIKNYISSNYMKEIQIGTLAKDLGYSRQHIARLFKEQTGMSVKDYLTQTRLENSKTFLKNGFTVKETAYLCGYNDCFNFSKAYKAVFGVSPSAQKRKTPISSP